MNKKIAGLGFSVFFLLPWVGFILSLFSIRSRTSAFVYVAFAMLLGYSISFTNDSADSYRYAQAFSRFENTLDYNTIVQMYRNGEFRDLYRVLLFYITSLFSNNPKVLYSLAGLVYGIFSYMIMRILVEVRGKNFDIFVFIMALIFFSNSSLVNVNGFRFWTGALVLFYSVYQCIIEKKNMWIIGIIVTPLFHYGFILLVPFLILYKFIHPMLYNNKSIKSILLYIFIASFIASWILKTNSINLGFLTESEVISGEIGERIGYINRDEAGALIEDRIANSAFLNVKQYFNDAIKIYVFVIVLFLYRLLKRMRGNKIEYNRFFSFILFYYSIAFVATSFPSGGRFLVIAHLFLFLYMAKMYAVYKRRDFQKLILWSLPVFAFEILFINGFGPIRTLTPTFWYGNFFWIIIEGIGFSVQ